MEVQPVNCLDTLSSERLNRDLVFVHIVFAELEESGGLVLLVS